MWDLDAFSVPMQGPKAGPAEHRMMYTALLYTPDKKHTRYLVDFDLDPLAEQVRAQARACGIAAAGRRGRPDRGGIVLGFVTMSARLAGHA